MAENKISNIVILGGGTAGWLCAGLIAAQVNRQKLDLTITLIEPSDIATIGVGEGSWPTLRETLRQIGISEKTFLNECKASFKQGTQFVNWRTSDQPHKYFHPFVIPEGYLTHNPAIYWQEYCSQKESFASAFTAQVSISELNLAPKQPQTPEFAAVVNYGYHFDAGAMVDLLRDHCVRHLGINLLRDKAIDVILAENNDVTAVMTEFNGEVSGDLFIDSTGFHSIVFDEVYKVPKHPVSDILFNDTAWVAQVPYSVSKGEIESTTKSTAVSSGWIWDISLQERKGTGYVFSGKHTQDDQALKELQCYHKNTLGVNNIEAIHYRKIKFQSAYRTEFWKNNCIAIGLSAGFVEPLEATAIALVEQNAKFLCEHLPLDRASIEIVKKRYNRSTLLYWERAVEFIKLHYVLSDRTDSPYWVDHRQPDTCPDELVDKLKLWRHQPASRYDLVAHDEFFSSASYQYILSGMEFYSTKINCCPEYKKICEFNLNSLKKKKIDFKKHLPTNSVLLNTYKD